MISLFLWELCTSSCWKDFWASEYLTPSRITKLRDLRHHLCTWRRLTSPYRNRKGWAESQMPPHRVCVAHMFGDGICFWLCCHAYRQGEHSRHQNIGDRGSGWKRSWSEITSKTSRLESQGHTPGHGGAAPQHPPFVRGVLHYSVFPLWPRWRAWSLTSSCASTPPSQSFILSTFHDPLASANIYSYFPSLPHPTLHTCPTWLLLNMFIHSFLKRAAPTIYGYQSLYRRLVAPDFHSPYRSSINLDSQRICYMQTPGPG